MASKQNAEFQFDLSGGQLALDLANTISRRDDPARRRDHLEDYDNVLSFLRQSRVLSLQKANELRENVLHHPAEARRSFANIIKLREGVYRTFAAAAQKKAVAGSDLKLINQFAVEALRHRALTPTNGGFGWEWIAGQRNALDRALWPMAQAAADLLTSGELKIVRFCEAPDCQWLFLDHSRNRSRRWCDMTTCGNRAKARRHYQRTRE
ncbi:MAG TPA: ABATE domain-containing protein [Bryocella sp.]|nr:ABATE domain-containing protein [Bryocella sp.]